MGLSSIFYRLSRGWVAILATIAFALFMAFVLPAQATAAEAATGGIGSPDTSFWYTPDQLRSFAEAYGESGRAAYLRARWTFDLIYPLVYGFFFVATISWCLQAFLRQDSTWRLLNLVPFSGMIFDYLDNFEGMLSDLACRS